MPRLTALEIEAVIQVAENALPFETFGGDWNIDENDPEQKYARKMLSAYERGCEKLWKMQSNRERQAERRRLNIRR